MRSSSRVCRSKRRVAISKTIVVRSSKSVHVQKKCNEVQKKRFPIEIARHGRFRSGIITSLAWNQLLLKSILKYRNIKTDKLL